MVDHEAVGLTPHFAVLAQNLADCFTLFPAVGKDQALFPPGMLKDIGHVRIRHFGSLVTFRSKRSLRSWLGAFRSLGTAFIKLFHG